jgi:1,4-dihydroxy-2-naphthoyl-CoA synthase
VDIHSWLRSHPVEYTTLPWDLNLNARKAKEIFFAQRFVLAEEALQIGLVNKVGWQRDVFDVRS